MSMQGGEEMEFGKQIKKLRQEAQLSQEELAERIYVSRQTISNWENDKSYPDVNSLVLLSETFQISLDKLIKGDIEVMKDVIQKEEIEKMNRYGGIYTMMLLPLLFQRFRYSCYLVFGHSFLGVLSGESQCISLLCLKK